MAQVSVTINSRQYRMGCDDGEEEHLARLAFDLDQRIAQLRTNFGEIGDMRLTVMAALMMAEEVSDVRGRLRGIEQELMTLQNDRKLAADRAGATEKQYAAALNSAAERVEKATRLLNQRNDGHSMAVG